MYQLQTILRHQTIVGLNANPASGTEITIIHVPSGSVIKTIVNDQGQYVFETFHNPAGTSVEVDPSLWEIRFGVRYSF